MYAHSYATFFRHSAVLSLPAVLLRKVSTVSNRPQSVMFCLAVHWNDRMNLGGFSRFDKILTSKGLLAVNRTSTFCGVFTTAAFFLFPKSSLVWYSLFSLPFILQIYRSPLCYDSPVFSSSRLSWSGPFLSWPHWYGSRQAFDPRGTGDMVGCGRDLAHNRKSSTAWRQQLGTVLLIIN